MAVVVGGVRWGHGCSRTGGVAVGGRGAIGVTSTKVVVGAGLSAAVRGRGGGVSFVVAAIAGAVSRVGVVVRVVMVVVMVVRAGSCDSGGSSWVWLSLLALA